MSGVVRFSTQVYRDAPPYIYVTVFANDENTGRLVMLKDEFRAFVDYLAMRDEVCDILDDLATDPGSARASYLAHRAARALGIQCQVVGFCKACDEERNEAANDGSDR